MLSQLNGVLPPPPGGGVPAQLHPSGSRGGFSDSVDFPRVGYTATPPPPPGWPAMSCEHPLTRGTGVIMTVVETVIVLHIPYSMLPEMVTIRVPKRKSRVLGLHLSGLQKSSHSDYVKVVKH